ncbi:MAG: PAS domain-containing protein, partial [Planctomycetota bacterium]
MESQESAQNITICRESLARVLLGTAPRAEEDFCRAAGRVLALCSQTLSAEQAYVVETSDNAGRVLAGYGPGGVFCGFEELQSAASPVASRWESALINGAIADGPKIVARPFTLDGKTVGVVLFCWDKPRANAPVEDPQRLVEACAHWVSGEWARRVEQRRQTILGEHRHRALVEGASDGLFEWDLVSNQVDYSPRWKQMLGFDADDAGNTPDVWFNMVDSSDLAQLEADLAMCLAGQTVSLKNQHRLVNAAGELRWMLCRAELIHDEDGTPL